MLILGIWLTVGWFAWMAVLSARPAWMLAMWGQGMTWDEAHQIVVTMMGAFKLIVLTLLMLTIWVSLWARQLGKQSGGAS